MKSEIEKQAVRTYGETQTLPMPRRKTVIVPVRRPAPADGFAEATAPGAATAETPDAAFIATTIGIKAALDPARFFRLSEVVTSGHFPIITADKASLRATLDPKTVQKVRGKIEQYGGPGQVALILHGRLGPNNTVLSPGLAVNPKPQKA